MNIEQLLGEPLSDIEKMSDKELEEYFGPCLNITRPDRALVGRVENKLSNKLNKTSPEKAMAMKMLANLGIDMEELLDV